NWGNLKGGRIAAIRAGFSGRGTVMRTVAFLNKKGGVGKTSACHHLSGALGQKGLRVLLVDADPQASLTQGLLGPEVARGIAPRETIAALFDEAGGPPVGEALPATGRRGGSGLARRRWGRDVCGTHA